MNKSIASRLRNRIKYQTRVVSHDTFGGPVDEWIDAFSCFAEVRAASGKEDVQKGLEYSVSTYKIVIRHREGVDPTGRIILDNGVILDVVFVADPNGRKELLVIYAVRKSTEGSYFEQNY